MSKRVWQYPEVTSIAADDYLLLDNETDGSKSILATKVGAILINKVVTERKVYKASEETGVVNGYKEVSVEVPYTTITDLEGDIVTFEDGEDLPMPSLKVGIEPQQDLHGYDSPWVGGAGKNKCPINSGTITVGDFVTFDTPLPSGTYSFSLKATRTPSSNSYATLVPYDINGNAYSNVIEISARRLDGSVVKVEEREFNNGISKIYVYSIAGNWSESRNYTLTISDLQIEQGSTATSYEPYSNICPISGHTEANIVVSPTTDAEDGHTYTIQFRDGDNPLTVYGGSLDVVSGELTVDRAYVDMGTLNYSYYSGNLFTASISNLKPVSNERLCNALCSIYVAKRGNEYASIDGSFVAGFNNSPILAIHDSRFTDASAFKTAMNGVQLVYELATPITYQLTPTQVKSLLGSNNVWADCGKSLVSYQKTWTPPDFTPEN